MKILVVVLMVMIFGAVIAIKGVTPQKRGLAGPRQDMLASNGRPALAVQPANGMRLHDAGWCSVQMPSSVSLEGSARVWYARYTEGNASLVLVLAEADDPWRWDFRNNTTYTMFDEREREYKDQTLYEGTYVLKAGKDPFAPGLGQRGDVLARRAKLMRAFRKVQVLAEYREVIPHTEPGKISPVESPQFLAEFEQRARDSFAIFMRDTGDTVPDSITSLEKAPPELSRRSIGTWLGSVRRDGRD